MAYNRASAAPHTGAGYPSKAKMLAEFPASVEAESVTIREQGFFLSAEE